MLNILRKVCGVLDYINAKLGQGIIYLGAILTLLVVLEVTLRYVFNSPTKWNFEFTKFLLCAMIAFGGGYVLYLRGHINVDVFYRKFGVRTKAVINLITSVIIFYYLFYFITGTYHGAHLSMVWGETSGSNWNPPLYPVMFFIPVGGGLMAIAMLSRFLRYLIQAISGQEEIGEGLMQLDEGAPRA